MNHERINRYSNHYLEEKKDERVETINKIKTEDLSLTITLLFILLTYSNTKYMTVKNTLY